MAIVDESSFELDTRQLHKLAEGFPAHPHEVVSGHPHTDLSYLRTAPGKEFRTHCWDECGH